MQLPKKKLFGSLDVAALEALQLTLDVRFLIVILVRKNSELLQVRVEQKPSELSHRR